MDERAVSGEQVHSVTFPNGETIEIVVDDDDNICISTELIDTVNQTGSWKRKQPEMWKMLEEKNSSQHYQRRREYECPGFHIIPSGLPSHCRSTSKRKYLPVEIQNVTNVYRT